ncbi:MAG: trigger factor [Candidatus Promineifilaceae bacterium]|nr:trigger factor [Candidatus Promineifilaceae bacterium]
MTLTIHKEEDDQRQLKLTVEVSEDQVENAMRAKARELGRELHFPGFRKGKVPYRVVVQRVGRDALRTETIDDMVQDVFTEMLEEIEVEPYAQPVFDDLELEPLVMKFTVPLDPVVTLGDYREMRKEIDPVEVTDEAVEEALEKIQAEHQTLEPVDRPVQAGDMVTISGRGELSPVEVEEAEQEDGGELQETAEPQPEILFDQESLDLLIDDSKLFPGTPFIKNIIEHSVGDELSFGFTFPEDYDEDDLAGREATFDLTIVDVKNRDLPPLDDELARLSGDHETLEELREALQEQLQTEAENKAQEELIEGAIGEMQEDADVIYPPAALNAELDEMMENFKNQVTRSGWEFEDYLKIQGSTEESLREDFRESAEARVARRLILRQFILDEKLEVNNDDISELVDERVARYENEELRQQVRDFYLSGYGFDMISSEILSKKVNDRLILIYSGEAPDLALVAEESHKESDSEEE